MSFTSLYPLFSPMADLEWLDAVNIERQEKQLDKISYEVFEIVMDRLEKDWFNLVIELYFKTKHIQKKELAPPFEDSCKICDDSEGENSNAIVFCDGCNLAVHQGDPSLYPRSRWIDGADCYGIPYIPEGQWLCRKCTVHPHPELATVFKL